MKETFFSIPSCPCKIAILADFHNGDPAPIISSLKRVQPSIITVPGDLFNGCIPGSGFVIQRYKRVLPLLHACSEIAPTFISLGNHDRYIHEFDIEIMKSLGCCTILDNTWTVFNGIVIGGLSSAWVTNYRKRREQVQSNERYPKVDAH